MEEQPINYPIELKIKAEFHDMDELKMAVHAPGGFATLYDVDNMFRNTIKYDENASSELIEYLEDVRDKMRELLCCNGVPLNIVFG